MGGWRIGQGCVINGEQDKFEVRVNEGLFKDEVSLSDEEDKSRMKD